MSKLKLRRPSPAMVVAMVALLVAMGGSAYAASKIGTSDLKNNAVTSNKLAKKAVKSNKLAKEAVKVNKLKDGAVETSKIGDIAVTNSKLFAPTLWAYVTSGGSIDRGSGATSATRVNAGNYRVTFEPNDPSLDGISECSYQATAADVGQDRTAQVDLDVTNNNRVFVRTRDTSAAGAGNTGSVDTAFHVAVFC